MNNNLLSSQRILLLGGTGFIGSHVAHMLLNYGATVKILTHKKSIMLSHPRLKMCRGDFANGQGIDAALDDVNLVLHFVSTTVPSTAELDPIFDFETNVIGTLRLLEKMHQAQVARIIFLSSGGTVYGQPQRLPVSENHALFPRCSYGVSKVTIENYLNLYQTIHNFKVSILRLSNPYGMHQAISGVQGALAVFLKKIAKNEDIVIWGDGLIVRDYIYIEDVKEALLQSIMINFQGTCNIGSGIGHSLLEVIDLLSSIIKRKPKLIFKEARPFDVNKIYLDVSLAKKEMGWHPRFSLEEGCRHFWELVKMKEK